MTAEFQVIDFKISPEMAGLRLDSALARLLPAHSRTRIKGWIEDGAVLVGRKPAKPRDIVAAGARLIGAGIAQIIGFILIDQDLDTHDRAEGSIEADLSAIYARLGVALPTPDPSRVKGRQNYVARVVVSIVTCAT